MRRGVLVTLLVIPAVLGPGCSQRPENVLAEVRRLHEDGRYQDSVDRLEALLDEDPEQPEANYLLGQALLAIGQAPSAIWPLRKAAESPDYAVEAGLLLTQALLRGRNHEDALAAADRVLEIAPDNVFALQLRIDALSAGRRNEEMLADIERLLELDPENVTVLSSRVMALIGLQQIDEAEQALEAAKQTVATAEREVPAAMRANLCVTSALFSFEKGDSERAESRYTECLDEFPTEPIAVAEGAAFYDRIGKRERATAIIRNAYDEFPNDFRGMLARRMEALGNNDEVERLLVEATEEDDSPASWFGLADHYVDAEDYEAAANAFEQALEVARNPDPMLVFAFADTLVQAGDYERALRVADDLQAPVFRDLVEGRALAAQGDPQGALRALESGIRLWPSNPGARLYAGRAAEELGDFERAVVHYRGAMRGGHGRTEAGALLAELHAAQGDGRLALDTARRYLQSRPNDPEAHRVAIRVAHRFGRHELCQEGFTSLAKLPGQAPRSVAEYAALVAANSGSAAAVGMLGRAPLDLTDPAAAEALRVLLDQLAARGAHEQARARAADALDAHPEEAVFHELTARALRAAGAPTEPVREVYERAVELDPKHAPALAGLAELAVETGDVERALALYDRAAKAAPDQPSSDYAAIQLLLEQGRSSEAQSRLTALLKRHPREARAAAALARRLVARGSDLDRALALARRAALFGPSGESFEVLGSVQLARGDLQPAIEALKRSLELEPDAQSARYELARALEAVGDEN